MDRIRIASVSAPERYASFEEFNARFKTGVNPVLEWRRVDGDIRVKKDGEYVVVAIMHEDTEDPFPVILPWSKKIKQYIACNKV